MSAVQALGADAGPAGARVGARVALTVAGSDPSGGAGVQADLKTFSALGVYGTAVLTALTAQSTRGVSGVHPVPAAFVVEQLETLLDDVRVDAVKTGMLATAEVVLAVAGVLAARAVGPLVVDPVMVSTSGHRLLDDDAVAAVRERLLPLAAVITPNAPEAGVLLGAPTARSTAELVEHAEELHRRTAVVVLAKGGHLEGAESVDVLVTAAGTALVTRARVATSATHGTGCTLSAAIAALAASGADAPPDWPGVVDGARAYLHEALLRGEELRVGSGHGPVHHFARWW